jgi:hypothetical protein
MNKVHEKIIDAKLHAKKYLLHILTLSIKCAYAHIAVWLQARSKQKTSTLEKIILLLFFALRSCFGRMTTPCRNRYFPQHSFTNFGT